MHNGKFSDGREETVEKRAGSPHAWQDERKFLTAVTGDKVHGSDHGLKSLCDLPQRSVSRSMSIQIVEDFEIVDIDHADAQGHTAGCCMSSRLGEFEVEVSAVRNPVNGSSIF
jgi:hypothetical protein